MLQWKIVFLNGPLFHSNEIGTVINITIDKILYLGHHGQILNDQSGLTIQSICLAN